MTTDTHHRDHAAFLRACAEEPRNHFPRLVYADWLEEVGEVDQAEYVRLSVELAGRESDPKSEDDRDTRRLRHRCQTLAKAGRPTWIGRYHRLFNDAGLRNAIGRKGLIRSLVYRRGLPEFLVLNSLPTAEWFSVVTSLLPVREVRVGLHDRRVSFAESAIEEAITLLSRVELADVRITAADVNRTAQASLLTLARSGSVRRIELNGCWSDDGTDRQFLGHACVHADFFYDRTPYHRTWAVVDGDQVLSLRAPDVSEVGRIAGPEATATADGPAQRLIAASLQRPDVSGDAVPPSVVLGAAFGFGMLGCMIADAGAEPTTFCGALALACGVSFLLRDA